MAFPHLASRDARRRAPRVPFGTTQEEFSFVIHMQVLLPALHPIDRAPARAHSTNPGHAHTKRRSTTRLRVRVGKTSRRRPAQAQRAAVTDSQERPPSEPCFRPVKTSRNGRELDISRTELDFTVVTFRSLVGFIVSVFPLEPLVCVRVPNIVTKRNQPITLLPSGPSLCGFSCRRGSD